MLDLFDFFNDVDVKRFLRNARHFSKDFERTYFNESNDLLGTTFKEVDGYYKAEFTVSKDANAKNVTVDFEDGVVKVSYSYEKDGYKSHFEWKETLPSGADDETLEAVVENGKLTITAIAHPKEDTTHVCINRK